MCRMQTLFIVILIEISTIWLESQFLVPELLLLI